MEGSMVRREITDGHLVIDWSADHRNAATVDRWRSRFGADRVRIAKNHAKIARVWNDRFKILIRGSMNLNFNPRFEQFDLTEDGPDFDLVERIESELPVLPRECSYAEIESASKLGKSFDAHTLAAFRHLRPRSK